MFDGNPVEYRSFIQAFENLIESRMQSSTERLYYLEQYTSGDVKELVRSCHHLPPEEGYVEARRLLLRKFGDEYRIASSFESKALPVVRTLWAAVCTHQSLTSQEAFRNWFSNYRFL